jgi:hypothetical protein
MDALRADTIALIKMLKNNTLLAHHTATLRFFVSPPLVLSS